MGVAQLSLGLVTLPPTPRVVRVKGFIRVGRCVVGSVLVLAPILFSIWRIDYVDDVAALRAQGRQVEARITSTRVDHAITLYRYAYVMAGKTYTGETDLALSDPPSVTYLPQNPAVHWPGRSIAQADVDQKLRASLAPLVMGMVFGIILWTVLEVMVFRERRLMRDGLIVTAAVERVGTILTWPQRQVTYRFTSASGGSYRATHSLDDRWTKSLSIGSPMSVLHDANNPFHSRPCEGFAFVQLDQRPPRASKLPTTVFLLVFMLLYDQAHAAPPTIEARIETVRAVAAAVVVDGHDGDWEGIPVLIDAAKDAGGKPALDLVRTAVVPRGDDLLILLGTAIKPIAAGGTYCVEIDLVGSHDPELQIGLGQAGQTAALVYERGKPPVQKPIAGVEFAIDRVVEIRVPYAAMIDLLPPATAKAARETPRPWVRIMPVTFDVFRKGVADYGASAASYRLVATPYPLDPPMPATDGKPVQLELPVAGQWAVYQGAFGEITHGDQWAYDFIVVDSAFRQSRRAVDAKNDDYFAWDREVTTPLAGRVIRATGEHRDQPPPTMPPKETPVNDVYLDIGGWVGLDFVHLRKGSVTAQPGEKIAAGTVVGRVGNSGQSATPHLHLACWRLPLGRKTLPLSLRRVRVSLNPVEDDYWARDLDEWQPREGVLVQTRAGN